MQRKNWLKLPNSLHFFRVNTKLVFKLRNLDSFPSNILLSRGVSVHVFSNLGYHCSFLVCHIVHFAFQFTSRTFHNLFISHFLCPYSLRLLLLITMTCFLLPLLPILFIVLITPIPPLSVLLS